MEREINLITLADSEIVEVVTPKVERLSKEQCLSVKADLENRLALINSILDKFTK